MYRRHNSGSANDKTAEEQAENRQVVARVLQNKAIADIQRLYVYSWGGSLVMESERLHAGDPRIPTLGADGYPRQIDGETKVLPSRAFQMAGTKSVARHGLRT